MLDSNQTRAFKKAYENYRSIISFLEINKDMIDIYKDNFQDVVKIADLEIQRMLWDVSLLEERELNETEQEFIKAIIEAPDILKVSVPGYFKFYRNMTSEKYKLFNVTLKELTKEVLLGVRTAIKLAECMGKNHVTEIIHAYQEIIYAYLDMIELSNKEEHKKRAKIWIDVQIKAAKDNGIIYEIEDTPKVAGENRGLSDIINDLNNLFKQQGLS